MVVMWVCACVRACVSVSVYAYVHGSKYVCVCMYVCMYACVCACLCVCMCARVCLRTHASVQVTRSSGVGSASVWTILRAYALGQLVVELLGKMKERVETWGLDSIRRYYE